MRISFTFLFAALFLLPVFAENSSDTYRQGEALALSGNYEEAGKMFQKTIQLSPYFCLGHYGLGKLNLMDGGDTVFAVKELETAVRLDQSFAKAHFYLGMGYMLNRKYVAAIKSFAEAYRRDSTYVEALYNIAALYDLIGEKVKSGVYFEKYKRKLAEEQQMFSNF